MWGWIFNEGYISMACHSEILQQGVNFWGDVQADGLVLIGIQTMSSIGMTDGELPGIFWIYSEKGIYLFYYDGLDLTIWAHVAV